jgi:cell fate regulator YaaT (PSP1 superfamily)
MPERQTVVAVKLRYNPKVFWFDSAFSTYETGDHVLVDTERGREIGLVIDPALEVTEKQVKQLKTPLKPVIRALTEADFERIDELDARGHEAMSVFRELIAKHSLDMKPVSVEFLFSGDKAVFYFSNDERVDFRDLVRDLAAHFHTRVDMRQIGVRDEARILGGLSHCGEELCCARLGGDFQPVSIRMAKEQDLPLNPSKISGACGRLMCCLRYEFEAYKDFKSRAPRKGAIIETPMGKAKVISLDTPREIITMRLEDGKPLSIPLGEFECAAGEDGKVRPCKISRDAIDRCASSSVIMALAALEQELVRDKTPAEGERGGQRDRDRSRGGERDRGRDRGRNADRDRERGGNREHERPTRRPRRSGRRSVGEGGDVQQGTGALAGAGVAGGDGETASRRRGVQESRPRPGQHSSGLRSGSRSSSGEGRSGGSRDSRGSRGSNRPPARPGAPGAEQPQGQFGERQNAGRQSDEGRRRRRRRSGGSGGSGVAGSSGAQGSSGGSGGANSPGSPGTPSSS